ncbi:MAG TPA: hypothetical protein VFT24_07935 [Vicinamibacterales bacterium]|nr:hypothetical protein [Vicinamibacterales bacterium]
MTCATVIDVLRHHTAAEFLRRLSLIREGHVDALGGELSGDRQRAATLDRIAYTRSAGANRQ